MPDTRFADWLKAAAEKRGIVDQLHLRQAWARHFGEELANANASKWWRGAGVPQPGAVVKLADLLDADEATGMYLAGYGPGSRVTAATAFRHWLADALDAKHWSADDLAGALSIPQQTLHDWLTGACSPGRSETVIDIAHALDAPDAVRALDAAGMTRDADRIRRIITAASNDPLLAAARTDPDLTEADRAAFVASYRRRAEETIHDFELRLADLRRRGRAEKERHGELTPGQDNGERAGRTAL